jgi:L-asparaginase II
VDPIRVTVQRGDVIESVHRVHVRTTDGVAYGDDVFCFLRSSAKPIQAIPLLEAYDDLTDQDLAIACASHNALPDQIAAVHVLLARAGATADDLECGPQDGRPDGKLGHNCSGKHAGMLAACRANGWPFEGYRLASHPLQQRIAELVGGEDTAIDGCGVPTFAMPLSESAGLLLRAPARIGEAMRARPELISWEGGNDARLMRLRPGWIAKGGAEGLFCAASPDGVGIALKVEDGANRALRPALGVLLGIEEFLSVPLTNSRGEAVGQITA